MGLKVNFDTTRLLKKMQEDSGIVLDETYVFLEQLSEIGAEAARTALDRAETDYGIYRMSKSPPQGNSTGRNDRGVMINALKAQEPEYTSNYELQASVGWSEDEYQDYFGYQEEGTGRIEAAHSLLDGLMQMEAEAPRLARNMKQRIRRKMK